MGGGAEFKQRGKISEEGHEQEEMGGKRRGKRKG